MSRLHHVPDIVVTDAQGRVVTLIEVKLTGTDRLKDMTTLVSSGTVMGGGQPGVFVVTSPRQLDYLRERGVSFEQTPTATPHK